MGRETFVRSAPPAPGFFLMPCIFIVFDFTFSKHALLFEENLFIRKYFQAYRKVSSKKEISRRTDSSEKTLMLGKIGGRRRRG